MKKQDVQIGQTYTVKVSGKLAPVKIISESQYGGWEGLNTKTHKSVRIRSAAKLRGKWLSDAELNAKVAQHRARHATTSTAPLSPVTERYEHDDCPKCGADGKVVKSLPAERVPDQTLRVCPECGDDWFEDLNRSPYKATRPGLNALVTLAKNKGVNGYMLAQWVNETDATNRLSPTCTNVPQDTPVEQVITQLLRKGELPDWIEALLNIHA